MFVALGSWKFAKSGLEQQKLTTTGKAEKPEEHLENFSDVEPTEAIACLGLGSSLGIECLQIAISQTTGRFANEIHVESENHQLALEDLAAQQLPGVLPGQLEEHPLETSSFVEPLVPRHLQQQQREKGAAKEVGDQPVADFEANLSDLLGPDLALATEPLTDGLLVVRFVLVH